jgi:CheY-like chemotaxis protein
MKLLLIEDEAGKRNAITEHVRSVLGIDAEVVECESLRAGLKELVSGCSYDLVLLDMSMPGFDVSASDPIGGEPESFAGQEIMAQMKLRGLRTPTAVVTQYKAFAKGTIGLSDLVDRYKREYSDFFVGAIYYSTAAETWKREMSELIARYRL